MQQSARRKSSLERPCLIGSGSSIILSAPPLESNRKLSWPGTAAYSAGICTMPDETDKTSRRLVGCTWTDTFFATITFNPAGPVWVSMAMPACTHWEDTPVSNVYGMGRGGSLAGPVVELGEFLLTTSCTHWNVPCFSVKLSKTPKAWFRSKANTVHTLLDTSKTISLHFCHC